MPLPADPVVSLSQGAYTSNNPRPNIVCASGDSSYEYRPYLYATGLFDRAWPAFREPVERHVRSFVDGEETLDRMAAALAQGSSTPIPLEWRRGCE